MLPTPLPSGVLREGQAGTKEGECDTDAAGGMKPPGASSGRPCDRSSRGGLEARSAELVRLVARKWPIPARGTMRSLEAPSAEKRTSAQTTRINAKICTYVGVGTSGYE